MGRRPKTELTLTRPGGSATRTRSHTVSWGDNEPTKFVVFSRLSSVSGEKETNEPILAVMLETLLYGPPCFCGVPWGVLCGVLRSEALPESEGRLLYR